ncbi:uncharacterized protein [Argopecten irradians]|uniref:uncharacterized protein n=1 Tax=Argopecten irradians TaxID=31199 RepID=UPI003721781E
MSSDSSSEEFNMEKAMYSYGNFQVSLNEQNDDGFVCSDGEDMDTLLESIDVGVLLAGSMLSEVELQSISEALKSPADPDLPPPEMPSTSLSSSTFRDTSMPKQESELTTLTGSSVSDKPSKTSRFKTVSEKQIKDYKESNQSKATKKNTAWGVKLFQEWHVEVYGNELDLATVEEDALNKILANVQQREEKMGLAPQHAGEYHKNSLKNLRAAINRKLQDLGRDIDIVRDKAIKQSNKTLNGLFTDRMVSGMSRPTAHKEIISQDHLRQISSYLEHGALSSPVVLRQAVWYSLAIHFVSRGVEFHHQLRVDSFCFKSDENGEYATLTYEIKQKNFQGGVCNVEAQSDKRMYATGTANCPVKLLRTLISKTDPKAGKLFNKHTADSRPDVLWYSDKMLAQRTFSNFMADICKGAGLDKKYTAHCLRATSIHAMSESDFSTRSIMFMSGHRNEASIRSYSRSFSSDQKKALSTTLSTLAQGNDLGPHATVTRPSSTVSRPSSTVSHPSSTVAHSPEISPTPLNQLSHVSMSDTISHQTFANSNSSSFTAGFLSHSVFHGCNFTFQN